MNTYKINLSFATLLMRANLAEASAPILFLDAERGEYEDDDFSHTGFQTADAQHNMWSAARLVVESCGWSWYAGDEASRMTDGRVAIRDGKGRFSKIHRSTEAYVMSLINNVTVVG